jgi:hypothetical protein
MSACTDGGQPVQIAYYIVPRGQGWRVHSRGFTWDFDTRQEANAFALEMAEHYACASGRSTCVRLQLPDGGFDELRSFAGLVALPTAVAGQLGEKRG